MKLVVPSLLILAQFLGWECGRADESRAGMQTAEISVVALGPKPTRKYEAGDDGDGPIMLLAKPDETPPSRLYYKGRVEGGDESWLSMNLPFNNPSVMFRVAPEKVLELHRRLPGGEIYEPYLQIPPLPPGSRVLFFCQPSELGPTPWKKSPVVNFMDLQSEKLRGKQLILFNLTEHTIYHAFDESVVAVKPDQIVSHERPVSGQLYRLAASYAKGKEILYNTAVRITDDRSIQLYVLYKANPATNSGRDVGVFKTMIRVGL